ncbi:hypothetical protein KC340_g17115 [Hortaea werneckii]|nr:hypothetical protein KC342_g18085 [Hortaea werneckii]KAI7058180.1 hypothetical protein KC339_g17699 [Hortaea werneckii]KAI7206033.1 hypothetical protein KC365_g17444 [Hortaea werneckii]KAI7291386.1 hypothetical protein KC340_g17115 [Hortaea werneckii]KAI7378238.1 hypothetical protein KC328_g13990 [Hortaea werneckii]
MPRHQIGGYSTAVVQNVALPEKYLPHHGIVLHRLSTNDIRIKCSRCSKLKAPTNFSNKQIDDLKKQIHKESGFNATTQGLIPCMTCTGAPRTELECHYCGITKSLDHFSKQQRKDPDRASCWDCTAERQNQAPGAGGSDSDSDITQDSDSYGDDSGDEDGTLSKTCASMSIGSSTARGTYSNGGVSLGSTGPASYADGGRTGSTLSSTQGGGVPLTGSRSIGTTASGRAPSTITQSSVGPNPTNSRGGKKSVFQDSLNDNKFAKVKAEPKKVVYTTPENNRPVLKSIPGSVRAQAPSARRELDADVDDEITVQTSDEDSD